MRPPAPLFFDPDWYLTVYPDVAASGRDPLRHYMRHGRREGRRPCALAAVDRVRDLRWGLAPGAGALEALRDGHGPAERAWAIVALARKSAEAGDWAAAHRALSSLDSERDLVSGFGLPDFALLAIEAALLAGVPDRAKRLWQLARRRFGPLPDLALAAANIAAFTSAPEARFGSVWRRALGGLFGRAGLPGLAVDPGIEPAFEGLRMARPGWLRPRRGPLVSVIVPAKNAEATLDTALRGLRDQSWRNLEILVVDNGSTDATAAILRHHAEADSRVVPIDGSGEPGAYAARNLGLSRAGGAFVTVHDADDWSHPAKIAAQVAALRRKPAAWASLSHWVRATPDLRFTRWWGSDGLVHRNISSLMLRRETVARLGYWDRVRVGADSEYLERIIALGGPGAVVEARPGLPLSIGRREAASLSRGGAAGIDSQLYGPRRSYRMAARGWHEDIRLERSAALPLPRLPAHRPFPAPSVMEIGDPPPPVPSPVEQLRASPLYDDRWLMQAAPDLRARDVDGAWHYLHFGAAEGRDPGPDFSTTGYLLDHDPGEENPLLHHMARGGGAVLPDLAGALPAPAGAPVALFVGHLAGARAFGAERSLLDMLDRAHTAGIVPVAVLPRVPGPDYLEALRARCHALHIRPMPWRSGRLTPPPRSVAHLRALIDRWGAAEMHQNTLVLDVPTAAARAAGVPAVIHVRELPAEDAQLCHDLGLTAAELRSLLLEEADLLVANSQAVSRWLGAPGRTVLQPNTVPPELFDLGFAPGPRPRAALIGALEPRKGLFEVLALAHAVPEIEFRLIGPDSPALAALGRRPANLVHAGYAEGPEAALAQCDIVLSLSRFAESFGRTVAEAMAAGRPVLCWDRGTPPELVGRDGTAGAVVPPGDVSAAAAALRLICTPGRLAVLSKGARARALAQEAAARAVSAAHIHPCLASDDRPHRLSGL